MKVLAQIHSFVSAVLHRSRMEYEIDEELQAHIEDRARDLEHSGVSKSDAQRRARLEFGGYQKFREECREAHGTQHVESFLRDVRYAFRMLRKSPSFTGVAVLTLALGIGITTAILSVVDPVLFRPLPYANADRLVSVGIKHAVEPFEFMLGSFYYHWFDNSTVFTEMTAQSAVPRPCDLTDRDPMRLTCSYVHQNFLLTLGLTPYLGRDFTADDVLPGAPLTLMVSYQLWKTRYGERSSIVNQLIEIDGVKAQVIAVLPEHFEMPSAQPTDLLLPKQVDVAAVRAGTVPENMRAFALLKPGITVEQAHASLEPLFEQSTRLAPPQMRSDLHLVVRSLRDRQMHDVLPVAWIMLGGVCIVLLVCCANAGSLFLARAAARKPEFAIRVALGASKRRILCQTLTEGFFVSATGAIIGWIFAEGLLRTFIGLAPDGMAFLQKATLDRRILLATVGLSFACGVVCGLLPLLELRSVAITTRSNWPSLRPRFRRVLVVAQIASSAVLLSGALLLVRSLDNIERQDIGFNSTHVLTVSASLSPRRYDTARRMDFFLRVVAALRGIPGVASVAVADSLPPSGARRWYSSMAVAGKPPLSSEAIVSERAVTADYFNALGIRIIRGRGFSEADAKATEHLVIMNQELAALMFANEDPLGQQVRLDEDGPFYRVVGIVADVKNDGITGQTLPEYTTLLAGVAEEWNGMSTGQLIIRTASPVIAAAPLVRKRIEEIDARIPIQVRNLDSEIHVLAARPRFETMLLSAFAGAGLLMASIGLYAVTAYTAAARTNEIGTRIALGATRFNIIYLILSEGLQLVLLGSTIGLTAALLTVHFLRSLLFLVGPYDPKTFICVAVLLALVGITAILVPAVRAMRLDPVCAIRYE